MSTPETKTESMPDLTLVQKLTALAVGLPTLLAFLESFGVFHLSDQQADSLQNLILQLIIPAVALVLADAGIRNSRNKKIATVEAAQIHADAAVTAAAATAPTTVTQNFTGEANTDHATPDTITDQDPADLSDESKDVLEEIDIPSEDDPVPTARVTPDVPEGDDVNG